MCEAGRCGACRQDSECPPGWLCEEDGQCVHGAQAGAALCPVAPPLRHDAPAAAVQIELVDPAGAATLLDMSPSAGGGFELSPRLLPGLYAYRFWPWSEGGEAAAVATLDADPARPHRTTVSGETFSELWVRDCRYPSLRLAARAEGDVAGTNPGPRYDPDSGAGSLVVGLDYVPGEDSFRPPTASAPDPASMVIRMRWPGEALPLALSLTPPAPGAGEEAAPDAGAGDGLGADDPPEEGTWRVEGLPEPAAGTVLVAEREGGARYLELRLQGLPRGRLRVDVELLDRGGRSTAVDRATAWEPSGGYGVADAPLRVPVFLGVPSLGASLGVVYQVIPGTFGFAPDAGTRAPVVTLRYPEHPDDRDRRPPSGLRHEGLGLDDVTRAVERGYFGDLGITTLLLSSLAPQAGEADCAEDASVDGHVAWFCGRTLGTWPVAARSVDADLGGEGALRRLIAAAHGAGLSVVVTVQANHVHQRHRWTGPGHLGWLRGPDPLCGSPEAPFPLDNAIPEGPHEELFPPALLSCSLRPFLRDVDWEHRVGAREMREALLWWLTEMDADGLLLDDTKHVSDRGLSNLSARVAEVFGDGPARPQLWGETATNWAADGCRPLGSPEAGYARILARLEPGLLDAQLDTALFDAIEGKCSVFGETAGGHGAFWTEQCTHRLQPYDRLLPFLSSPDRQLFARSLRGSGDTQTRQLLGLTWLLSLPGRPLLMAGDELGPAALDPAGALERGAVFERVAALAQARRAFPQVSGGQWRRLTRSSAPETMGALRTASVAGVEQHALVLVNVSDADKSVAIDGVLSGPTDQEIQVPLPDGAQGCYQDLLGATGDAQGLLHIADGVEVALPALSAALLVPAQGCPPP